MKKALLISLLLLSCCAFAIAPYMYNNHRMMHVHRHQIQNAYHPRSVRYHNNPAYYSNIMMVVPRDNMYSWCIIEADGYGRIGCRYYSRSGVYYIYRNGKRYR